MKENNRIQHVLMDCQISLTYQVRKVNVLFTTVSLSEELWGTYPHSSILNSLLKRNHNSKCQFWDRTTKRYVMFLPIQRIWGYGCKSSHALN